MPHQSAKRNAGQAPRVVGRRALIGEDSALDHDDEDHRREDEYDGDYPDHDRDGHAVACLFRLMLLGIVGEVGSLLDLLPLDLRRVLMGINQYPPPLPASRFAQLAQRIAARHGPGS